MLLLLSALLFAADKAEIILPLAGSKSDHLEVQAGGLVLREGEAGAAFGAAQIGKDKRQLTYFLVIKHDLGKAEKTDFNEEANADNSEGSTKQVISLDGRTIEVVHKVRVESGKKVSESLTVNKEAVVLSKGRVLLVDLTASTPRWEQRKADLPAEVEASSKKAAAELAKKVLASLAKQDKKVKEFIDRASR